jgi:hypothetical protein
MTNDWLECNTNQASGYPANTPPWARGVVGYGIATDPRSVTAMNAEQMAAYIMRQGDPTNIPMSMRGLAGMQNAWRPQDRRPTMTLAEYDARRAAFKPR